MKLLKLDSSSTALSSGLYYWLIALSFCLIELMPELAHASVESSLLGLQTKMTHVILPCLSVMGIVWAAISLLSGNEKAKTHVFYAIIASAFGFGAQAIVDFISQTVR